MAGFFLLVWRNLKFSKYFLMNTLVVCIFVVFYSFFYLTELIDYSNYFALHIRNIIFFLFLYSVLRKGDFDSSNILLFLSYFIFMCAVTNILIIMFFPKPWIVIAAVTGTEEDGFAHLYTRLILPFGTPNQLGFVSGLLAMYHFFSGRKYLSFIMLVPMFGASSNSSLIPMLVVILLYMSAVLIKSNSQVIIKWRNVFILLIISILSVAIIFSFGGVEINPSGGRSLENVEESISRHLIMRTRTIESISEFSFLQYFYGVGPGNSYLFIGGTYSFTVLLTLFFEFGFFGLYSYLMHLKMVSVFKSNYSFYILIFVIMASLMYQLNNDVSYYILPLLINYQLMRKSNENNLSV